MQEQKSVVDCYNSVAKVYADKFSDELSHKPFDRMLLRAFADEAENGKVIDLGCGPGQTTKFLSDCGVSDLLGTDISPAMVAVAAEKNPHLHFETADMLRLSYPDNTFSAALAFYSIVHFNDEQLTVAFSEIYRVLQTNGSFLMSFHSGNEKLHLDEFLESKVNIDFYFFEPEKIITLLQSAGFKIIDSLERAPYAGHEYPSRRAYIWTEKI